MFVIYYFIIYLLYFIICLTLKYIYCNIMNNKILLFSLILLIYVKDANKYFRKH